MKTIKLQLKSYQECEQIDQDKRTKNQPWSGSLEYMKEDNFDFNQSFEVVDKIHIDSDNGFEWYFCKEKEYFIDLDWIDEEGIINNRYII